MKFNDDNPARQIYNTLPYIYTIYTDLLQACYFLIFVTELSLIDQGYYLH